MPSNLALMQIEIDTLWDTDERGRLLRPRARGRRRVPAILIGAAVEGWALAYSSELADTTADELRRLFVDEPPAADPSQPPAKLDQCERMLEEAVGGAFERRGDLSYVIPPDVSFTSEAEIVRSDTGVPDALRRQDLVRLNWRDDEWGQLLDGELGPWAFVIAGDRVVSMCHSARLTELGAEAGTWTDPDYRGRGYAAAATAAWASLLAPSGRTLFYSTWADNVSSQRVASRLGLPLIGRIWTLTPASEA